MRVGGRAAVAALAGLIVGLAFSFGAAAWLRSATPEANLLWGIAPPFKVAIWTLTGAHGATLHIEAGAEVDERLGDVADRIGEIFGRDDPIPEAPSGDFAVQLAPVTILAIVSLTIALMIRGSGASSLSDVAVAAVVAGAVNGIGLAVLASASQARLGFDVQIVRAGVEAGVAPATGLVVGFIWGAIFVAIGTLRSPGVTQHLSLRWRAVGAGVSRAAIVAVPTVIVCLVVLAIAQRGDGDGGGFAGRAIDPELTPLGIALLALNVVGAAIVLAHGAPLNLALDAGPLSGFTRLGYMPEGATLSPARWLFVLVPILGAFSAGRAMRRRLGGPGAASAALGLGAVWGLAMAALAVLLRVRVLSNFDIGSLEGGGGASIDPLLALGLGFGLGTVLSYIGLVSGGREPRPSDIATPAAVGTTPESAGARCGNCGRPLRAGGRFCSACGTPVV